MSLRPPAHPGAARGRMLERFTWIAAVILVLGTLAFLGIAEEVAEGDTLHLDERILMAMRVPGDRQQPIGPDEAFRDFTGLGGVGVLGPGSRQSPGPRRSKRDHGG
jgi:hypothetical protein